MCDSCDFRSTDSSIGASAYIHVYSTVSNSNDLGRLIVTLSRCRLGIILYVAHGTDEVYRYITSDQ